MTVLDEEKIKNIENENVLTYVQLDKEAELIPIGAEGLLAVETFQGSRTPGKYGVSTYAYS